MEIAANLRFLLYQRYEAKRVTKNILTKANKQPSP